ncbi:hypothetical protein ACFX13_029888 [Malus domestica]|nr:gibberellin 2-beta-dioxygenase 6-like [Malus domestica]
MASESYPPPFRSLPDSTQAVDLDDQVNPVHDMDDPIPVVDLQSLKLGEACEFWGIFRLVNHGVPPTLLTQLRENAKMVFFLPFESKQNLITSPLSYFWDTPALTPSGAALSTKGSSTLQNINWVEGLNVPLAQLSQFQTDNPIIASFRIPIRFPPKEKSMVDPIAYGSVKDGSSFRPAMLTSSTLTIEHNLWIL